MEHGSLKDVLRWFKPPWLRASAVVLLLSYGLWLAVRWALMPGFAELGGLSGPDDTPLTLAKQRYGPILLVKWWITDPSGTWGDKWLVLQQWGYFETSARLLLIVVVLWLTVCISFLFPRLMRAFQPKAPSIPASTDNRT